MFCNESMWCIQYFFVSRDESAGYKGWAHSTWCSPCSNADWAETWKNDHLRLHFLVRPIASCNFFKLESIIFLLIEHCHRLNVCVFALTRISRFPKWWWSWEWMLYVVDFQSVVWVVVVIFLFCSYPLIMTVYQSTLRSWVQSAQVLWGFHSPLRAGSGLRSWLEHIDECMICYVLLLVNNDDVVWNSCGDALCTIAASTTFTEPFVTGMDQRRLNWVHKNLAGTRCSDHVALLNAFQQWEQAR